MKQHLGIWFPDHEQHMLQWMSERMKRFPKEMVDGKGTYQYHKLVEAMSFVKKFRVAVDVGAHVGLWSMHLAKRFEYVHAFEPIAEHRECFAKNVTATNVDIYPVALGDHSGMVSIATTKGSSGDTKVVRSAGGDYTLKRLDDVLDEGCIDHNQVDFLKVDCEGYELFVLKGAEELLVRNRPCIIVEQKPGFARRYGADQHGAINYLQSLGATLRKEIGGDFILTWD